MSRPILQQTGSNPAENEWSFFTWAASTEEHIVTETSKAFAHVQSAVLQFFNPETTTDEWSVSAWAAATQKHIVTEVDKAFDHVQSAALHFFNAGTCPNTTPVVARENPMTTRTGLPSVIIAKCIAGMLDAKDAWGLYTFFTPEDREHLLHVQPHLVTKIVRFYKADLDKVPAVWMQAIARVRNDVRSLDLHGIAIRPIYVKNIVQLFPNLRDFNLENCELSDQCLYHLRNTRLERLELDKNEKITEFGINWLSKLAQAKTIALPPFTYHVDLLSAFLRESLGNRVVWHPLPHTLEHLALYIKYPLSQHLPQFFRSLKEHCRNVTMMRIHIADLCLSGVDELIDGLKTLHSLEKLVFQSADFSMEKLLHHSGGCITNTVINKLTELMNLHTLELTGSYNHALTDDIFNFLVKFTKLERFALDHAYNVNLDGIQQLSILPNFRSLSLRHQTITNNTLLAIFKLSKLQTLDLVNCYFPEWIQPETIFVLCQLPELHTLCISNCGNLPLLEHIPALPKLQKLKLRSPNNSSLFGRNNALAHLPNLPELTEIEIPRCSYIDDDALVTLAKCPKLKKVNLPDNRLTPEKLEKFRRALPDITIST